MENEKLNNNESMQKFNLYMIKDKTTGVHSLLYQSYSDDRLSCNEILNYLGSVFKKVPKASKSKFMQSLHNSCIVKVASVDVVTGVVIPDYVLLADLRDVKINDEKENKENGKQES